MDKILSIKDELGDNLVKQYRDFLALDLSFKYLSFLELNGDNTYEKKQKSLAKNYIDLLMKPLDKNSLNDLLATAIDDIKKLVIDFNAYNCYANEMAILNETYSSNYNEIDLYGTRYSKENIISDIRHEYKNIKDEPRAAYDFITYMNFILPSRYTKLRYKDKIVEALKIKKLNLQEQKDLAYEIVDYVNSSMTLRATHKVAYCEGRIDKIKAFFAGEDNGVDEKFILDSYTEISGRQLLCISVINIIQVIMTYLMLAMEEDSKYKEYFLKIDNLSDDDLNKMSEVHYNILEKLSTNVKFNDFQYKLRKLDELFFVFELDYARLVHKFLNRKEVFTANEPMSFEEIADLLISSCTNNDEKKIVKRVRMRVMLSELPVTCNSIDELFAEVDNAFSSASDSQLNWFTSEFYEYLGQGKDEIH